MLYVLVIYCLATLGFQYLPVVSVHTAQLTSMKTMARLGYLKAQYAWCGVAKGQCVGGFGSWTTEPQYGKLLYTGVCVYMSRRSLRPRRPHVLALSFLDQEVPKTVLHFGSIPAAVVMERSRTHALAVPIDAVCANDDKQHWKHMYLRICASDTCRGASSFNPKARLLPRAASWFWSMTANCSADPVPLVCPHQVKMCAHGTASMSSVRNVSERGRMAHSKSMKPLQAACFSQSKQGVSEGERHTRTVGTCLDSLVWTVKPHAWSTS